ncbi:MAG: zinc ABC transporter substrate-binding protein [Chloroflexi bacterium]|mgnify:CR=1 FL=1|nr:zinc ABC transporter substrate-binding protein [Chloroflexota bacterium]
MVKFKIGLAWLLASLFLATGLAACGDATSTIAPTAASISTASNNTSGAATTAATNSAVTSTTGKIKVLATTTQLGDFARNIGGDRVEVTTILRPDDDPHDYDPTADDSKNAAAAQLIVKNGVGTDDWLDKIITNSGTKAPLIDTSEGIKLRAGNGSDEEKQGDPHIWHSTDNAKIMVANVAKGLTQVDPTNKEYYQSQLTAYQKQLDDLKAQITQIFAPVPVEKRKLVTNHDAFGYFTDEFQITVVGSVIPSFSDAAQPTPQEINELIKNIKDNNVKVIFTETTINPKIAEQVAGAAGVKIYSNLYGDALGAPGTDGDTYLKMELSNAKNMAAGFQQ